MHILKENMSNVIFINFHKDDENITEIFLNTQIYRNMLNIRFQKLTLFIWNMPLQCFLSLCVIYFKNAKADSPTSNACQAFINMLQQVPVLKFCTTIKRRHKQKYP